MEESTFLTSQAPASVYDIDSGVSPSAKLFRVIQFMAISVLPIIFIATLSISANNIALSCSLSFIPIPFQLATINPTPLWIQESECQSHTAPAIQWESTAYLVMELTTASRQVWRVYLFVYASSFFPCMSQAGKKHNSSVPSIIFVTKC